MMSEDPKTSPRPSNASRMDAYMRRALEAVHEAHEMAERIDAGRDSTHVQQLAEVIRQLEEARKNALRTLEG